MFDTAKFRVELGIDKVTRIPYSSGSVFVKWNVTDSPRPDAHGRTISRSIQGTESVLDYKTNFNQRIGLRSSTRLLRNSVVKFEIMWEPDGGRPMTIGVLNLDLAQYAVSHKAWEKLEMEKEQIHLQHGESKPGMSDDAAYKSYGDDFQDVSSEAHGRHLMYLLSGTHTNCLIQIRVALEYVSGETDYKIPGFTGPSINFSGETNPDAPDGNPGAQNKANQGERSREKIRKLRESVLHDLQADEARKINGNEDWHNLDNLLMGRRVRIQQNMGTNEEFAKYHINSNVTIEAWGEHKVGRPYEETEIRDSFATWTVTG